VNSKTVLALAAMLAGFTAGGCSTSGDSIFQPPPYADFLSQPHRLAPVPGQSGALEWEEPVTDLRQYRRVLLERIQVRLADNADYKTVDPADLKTLVDTFHQAIVKALGAAYPVVDKPGPDVLRVRIVIFDLVATQPIVSAGVFFTPYATTPDLRSGPATGGVAGSAPYLGRTGIAMQFLDSMTGRVVAEYADVRFGRKYVVDTNAGVVSGATVGMSDYVKAFSTWAYAQQAFNKWAQQFRARLDQINGK
jgi:hypothetical protein